MMTIQELSEAYQETRPSSVIFPAILELEVLEKRAQDQGMRFDITYMDENLFDDSEITLNDASPAFVLKLLLLYPSTMLTQASSLMSEAKSIAANHNGVFKEGNTQVPTGDDETRLHDVAIYRFVADTASIGRG